MGSNSTLRAAADFTMTSPLSGAVLAHERRQNRVESLLNVRIGQRAVWCLERQTHCNAHRTGGYTRAGVSIEKLNAAFESWLPGYMGGKAS